MIAVWRVPHRRTSYVTLRARGRQRTSFCEQHQKLIFLVRGPGNPSSKLAASYPKTLGFDKVHVNHTTPNTHTCLTNQNTVTCSAQAMGTLAGCPTTGSCDLFVITLPSTKTTQALVNEQYYFGYTTQASPNPQNVVHSFGRGKLCFIFLQ